MNATTRILLVDDDADLRRVLCMCLRGAGYAVDEASNGREAIAAYREDPPDLVITDMYMPGSDGVDVIMRLRSEFPSARFMAISGGGFADSTRTLATARGAGAIGTLPKPFTRAALLEMLTDCLGLRRGDMAEPYLG